jgi:DNA-binding IscR family transcriptional regulator
MVKVVLNGCRKGAKDGNTKNCEKTSMCAARTVWKELSEQWKSTLEKITLKDMLEREKALGESGYSI